MERSSSFRSVQPDKALPQLPTRHPIQQPLLAVSIRRTGRGSRALINSWDTSHPREQSGTLSTTPRWQVSRLITLLPLTRLYRLSAPYEAVVRKREVMLNSEQIPKCLLDNGKNVSVTTDFERGTARFPPVLHGGSTFRRLL